MGMKKCGKCQQTKSRSCFYSNKAKPDGLQSCCIDCKRRQQKRWYDRHKKEQVARVRIRSVRIYYENCQRLLDYLLSHPCIDCGETDPIVLEFDHVRGQKRANVTRLLDRSWQTVLDEIDKCDVRCANDHRRVTARRGGFFRSLKTTGMKH